ncbi:hypothetical protein K0M31_015390, partial [Melipona bicolor]
MNQSSRNTKDRNGLQLTENSQRPATSINSTLRGDNGGSRDASGETDNRISLANGAREMIGWEERKDFKRKTGQRCLA